MNFIINQRDFTFIPQTSLSKFIQTLDRFFHFQNTLPHSKIYLATFRQFSLSSIEITTGDLGEEGRWKRSNNNRRLIIIVYRGKSIVPSIVLLAPRPRRSDTDEIVPRIRMTWYEKKKKTKKETMHQWIANTNGTFCPRLVHHPDASTPPIFRQREGGKGVCVCV